MRRPPKWLKRKTRMAWGWTRVLARPWSSFCVRWRRRRSSSARYFLFLILQLIETMVIAAPGKQVLMRPFLHQSALVGDEDAVQEECAVTRARVDVPLRLTTHSPQWCPRTMDQPVAIDYPMARGAALHEPLS